MADQMDEELREVGASMLYANRNDKSYLTKTSASQSRSLVLHWQDRGRGISPSQPQRNTTIHRCIDGNGMGPDRYRLHVPSLLPFLMESPENVSVDLESFCRHAGRNQINTDDVLLITRRNDALHAIMQDFIDKENAKKAKGKGRGKAKR